MQDIIDFAVSQGVLVMGAAGNNNNDVPFFPATYRGVFAVANVWGSTDVRYGGASGSCYGGWLDVAAPGESLVATIERIRELAELHSAQGNPIPFDVQTHFYRILEKASPDQAELLSVLREPLGFVPAP